MKLLKWMFGLLLALVVALSLIGYLYLYVLPTGPQKTDVRPTGAGKDSFVINAYQHTERKTIRVWTYKPQQWTADGQVLFVMHGMGRNAESYLDAWSEDRKSVV